MQEAMLAEGNVPPCVSIASSMQEARFQPVLHSHLADMA